MRAGNMIGGAYEPELLIETEEPLGSILVPVTAVAASATTGLLSRAHRSLFTLTTNGRAIEPGSVAPFPGEPIPDPGAAAALPAVDPSAAVEPIVEKLVDVGDKPADAGTSLQETQDRRLFLRAACERRVDGLHQIDVWVHRPNGSTFRFLAGGSTDADAGGAAGGGRAPDGLSLISAGVGFCFMTQIGRFAKIVDTGLGPYHIVQDTRFSRGRWHRGERVDASSPGRAGAPETHVYLHPDGDDEFARHALAMSEQTCFLHALCRTALRTKIHFGRR